MQPIRILQRGFGTVGGGIARPIDLPFLAALLGEGACQRRI